ncbi:MAG TPA: YceI family protein [Actinomycetota bacterium]|jgi:polyisoprenoid-binding protein YceI|nr:YceI family protein [Actinomycetota bacterium]
MTDVNTARSVNGIELPPAGAYAFDKAHTTVGFVARHMLSKVRGRFTEFDGQVKLGDVVEDSSVQVDMKAESITTDNEGRDQHLRGEDFLEAETYPTLSFASTGFRAAAGNAFELDGDLTIKGETHPVTLKGEFLGWGPGMQGGTLASFTASTTIDREDWDLTWNVAVETGGWLVGKKVDIVIDADLVLQD